VRFFFFFSFPKFQISRIESIYWTALTACLEGQKNEKNERESIYDEHVHGDGNQLLLSFSSSSFSSSVVQVKKKERTMCSSMLNPSDRRPPPLLCYCTVDGTRPTEKKKKWK
jgi:hypothetical protein